MDGCEIIFAPQRGMTNLSKFPRSVDIGRMEMSVKCPNCGSDKIEESEHGFKCVDCVKETEFLIVEWNNDVRTDKSTDAAPAPSGGT